MASQLPMWVQYLQALSTPAIALLALVIGVAQWRTSHQRAVLDLFERRMAIFDAISGVIGGVAPPPSRTQAPSLGQGNGSICCSDRK